MLVCLLLRVQGFSRISGSRVLSLSVDAKPEAETPKRATMLTEAGVGNLNPKPILVTLLVYLHGNCAKYKGCVKRDYTGDS